MNIPRNLLASTYLMFAVAGALFPTLANIEFMQNYGPSFNIVEFVELANINPAAQSLSRDLFISASAVFIWIISESRKLSMKNMWMVVLGTFLIAFAFSAPLFLFLRERRLIELEKKGYLFSITD